MKRSKSKKVSAKTRLEKRESILSGFDRVVARQEATSYLIPINVAEVASSFGCVNGKEVELFFEAKNSTLPALLEETEVTKDLLKDDYFRSLVTYHIHKRVDENTLNEERYQSIELVWEGPVEFSTDLGARMVWFTQCGRYRVAKRMSQYDIDTAFIALYREVDKQANGSWAQHWCYIQEKNGAEGYYPECFNTLKEAIRAIEMRHCKLMELDSVISNSNSLVEEAKESGYISEKDSKTRRPLYPTSSTSHSIKRSSGKLSLYGHPITAILRWMGKEGWTSYDAETTLHHMGNPVARGTVSAQISAGKSGQRGDPAPLTPDQCKELQTAKEAACNGNGARKQAPSKPLASPKPQKQAAPHKTEQAPSKPLASPTRTDKVRVKLFGEYPPTAVLRWMGKEGWDKDDAHKVMESFNIEVSMTTIAIQLKAGQVGNVDRGPIPKLSKEQTKELINRMNQED